MQFPGGYRSMKNIPKAREQKGTPMASTATFWKEVFNADVQRTSPSNTSGVPINTPGEMKRGPLFNNVQVEKNPNPPKQRVVHLNTLASTITPLHRYFSFVRHDMATDGMDVYAPRCVRCPNCKGCQLHMQFCSGAYGMRHKLAWIVRRRSPRSGEKRTIEMRCASEHTPLNFTWRRVCRFEVGPVVITRHLINTSRAEILETLERGGTVGTFAGMVCPRPLNFRDIFFGIFLGTTDRGRDKRHYSVLQRTAMRSVATQARAMWEKLTFSPEKQNTDVLAQKSKNQRENGDSTPRRVQVDWRCPPLFFSLLPKAGEGNMGITFVLWLSFIARPCLTAHIIENEKYWRAPHTCQLGKEEDEAGGKHAATHEEKPMPTCDPQWVGEVGCTRCHSPAAHWGYITRRHREDRDKTVTVLRVRRSHMKREVTRRTMLRHHNIRDHISTNKGQNKNNNNGSKDKGSIKNDVIWMNKQKTRAQFMALLVAYMMRTTVCGPYKQRRLTSPPAEAFLSV